MIDWGRPFRAAYHPARAYLLHKGLLGLLAFDVWVGMLEHAGRYGAGGFNVAHFAFIDAVTPLPTPALYGGMLLLAGLLSLAMFFAGAPRAGKAVLAVLYTSSWLISLHDAYQHHYFLSYMLAFLVFVPDVSLAEAAKDEAQPVRGVGLPLAAITCGIVYAFTGVAKSEADWRSGAVLKRLSHSRAPGSDKPGKLDALRDLLLDLGLDDVQAWHAIALSVIALQWVVAIGYLASVERDERPSRVRTLLASLALLGAFSFHAFAELGHMFDIGWFSYYMLWLALVLLGPVRVLHELSASLASIRAQLAPVLTRLPAAPSWLGGALTGAGVLALVVSGIALDIPGALGASLVASALAVAWVAWLMHGGRAQHATRVGLSVLACALAMYLSIAQTTARFDYYRRAAGELSRMGELETALALYLKADAYAPPGHSRQKKIAEIRSKLAERGPSAPAP
jgi:hypothetical protein